MQLDLGMLADNAHIDPTGKLYILGEFRYINAVALPALHGRMVLVFRLVADAIEVRDKGTADLELEVVDQDGHPIGMPRSPKMPIRFAPVGPADRGKWWAQVTIELQGLLLTKVGDYRIFIIANGQNVGSVPFHVQLQQPPK
ncbi:MAG TPA: hypothetical protein VIW28_04705 [Gemmatimonadales bacterium]|jgi:hypothetical protein